jgi:hypothetical protein
MHELSTGHSLYLYGPRTEWWRRFERTSEQVRALAEGGADERSLRRIERYLHWARNAYVVATVHAAGAERVERESRRAWRWLREAERELEALAPTLPHASGGPEPKPGEAER